MIFICLDQTDFDQSHSPFVYPSSTACLAPEVKFSEKTNMKLNCLHSWDQGEAEVVYKNLDKVCSLPSYNMDWAVSDRTWCSQRKSRLLGRRWTFRKAAEACGVSKGIKRKFCLVMSARVSVELFMFLCLQPRHPRSCDLPSNPCDTDFELQRSTKFWEIQSAFCTSFICSTS